VGARGNQSAAEIANEHLALPRLRLRAFDKAALADPRDRVPDKAGPPRFAKRVFGSPPQMTVKKSKCGDSLGRKAEEERSKAFWAVARCVL